MHHASAARLLLLFGLLACLLCPAPSKAGDNVTPEADSPPLCRLPTRPAVTGQPVRAARRISSTVAEVEPNNTQAGANLLTLGLLPGSDASVDVTAALIAASPTALTAGEEDGSIVAATATGLAAGQTVVAAGVIGDGPYAATSGDYDFYSIVAVSGQTITADIDAKVLGSGLDSYVGLYNSTGVLLAKNDDDSSGGTSDSFLEYSAPMSDTYFVVVRGFGRGFQTDPFDPASGVGIASVGSYAIKIGLDSADRDFFSFDLQAGDIFGAAVAGATPRLSLRDASGSELIGAVSDLTAIYPDVSPLPGGVDAALSWVVATSGRYTIRVAGDSGAYGLQLRVFRTPMESQSQGTRQILFLDFDGATVDASKFGGSGMPTLSPLAAFLGNWGLVASDEDSVIDAVVDAVRENFDDIAAAGNNGDFATSGIAGQFAVDIRNSRYDADPWGLPNVTRIVVGGSIRELGVSTVGISDSIDVGNFASSETGVVLLDVLSAAAGQSNSLNNVPIDASTDMVHLVGMVLGNAASHEAGHLFGSFHTDGTNALPSLMDKGTNAAGLAGVGNDGIFGTADDVDLDFNVDAFAGGEGFTGSEDTININAFDLATGTGAAAPTATTTPTPSHTIPASPVAATPTRTATATRTITPTPLASTQIPTATSTAVAALALCNSQPRPGCRSAHRSTLLLRNGPSYHDSLSWKWTRGKSEIGDFGAPLSTTGFTLCVYDSRRVQMGMMVPPGGTCTPGRPCWRTSARGYVYRDPALLHDGVRRIALTSQKGVGSIAINGSDAKLPVPALPLTAPLTVQLVSSDDTCWEAVYTNLLRNTATRVGGRTTQP